MALRKNQPGYVEAKDKNGRTYWKKADQGNKASDVSLAANTVSEDFEANELLPYAEDPEAKQHLLDLLDEKKHEDVLAIIKDLDTPEDVASVHRLLRNESLKTPRYNEGGEEYMLTFAQNEHTPDQVLRTLVEYGQYNHIYHRYHQRVEDAILSNPNISDETIKFMEKRRGDIERDSRDIDNERNEIKRIQEVFAANPGLEDRINSVYESRGNTRNERIMYFNPEDVEKVGIKWIMKNKVRLFGASYNSKTGIVHGYTN